MRIHLTWKVPLGGLEISGEFDEADLPSALRERTRQALDDGSLLRSAESSHPRIDAERFEIRVDPGSASARGAVLDEENLTPEVLSLLRELVQVVARGKLGEGGG